MGGLIMQRIFILLFCFALLACASTPKPTQEQLCIEAEKDKALAKTVLTYDKLQAVRYAMEAQKICPTPVNSAYLAFINSEAGMIDMGVLWAQHAMKQDSNNVEVRGGLGCLDRKQGFISGKLPLFRFMPQPVSALECCSKP
jgi:hypothetical protein